ncbi:MAG TPA: NADH-quinone oxidoreductase subunit NuoE [Limnochordia bacterium]|nr:NADH-quinone oxidoreductase subunit NuoE [Bacillota bacterium]HKM16890.1 NADH-quinone oxidoreductase subunit NuoE [Limnochordia bacterium]
MQVSSEQLLAIEQIVNKYRDFSGAAIPILQEIQNQLGYVSPQFIDKVSELTEIPASELYGIVTFYSQFRLEPIGEHHIQICHGTACHLAGADKIIEAFESSTGTKCGATSKDGKFTLDKVACIGCCSLAPVISVNGKIYGRMTAEKAQKLVREL